MGIKKRLTNDKHKETKKRIRVGKLESAREVAKFQARMIKKAVKDGSINDAYKLVLCASMLVKTIEVSSLEERITTLEKSILIKK